MRVLWGVSILTVTLALVPAPAPAQSLGEAAAREKERREKEGKKPPTKSFTDSDLGTRAGSGTVSQPGSSTGSTGAPESTEASPVPKPEGAGETKAEKTEEEIRAENQEVWRKQRQATQEEVDRLTAVVNKLQLLANDMTVSLYGPGRVNLLNQLETAKKSLAQAQQMLADFEEEGRRKGYR
jgi:hypothetical protein